MIFKEFAKIIHGIDFKNISEEQWEFVEKIEEDIRISTYTSQSGKYFIGSDFAKNSKQFSKFF